MCFEPERLSRTDKVVYLPRVVGRLGLTVVELAAFRLGKRGRHLSPEASLQPPMTEWAEAARKYSSAVLGNVFHDHSVRTWCFGTALAQADGSDLDDELFYVAAMLHDIGLREPVAGRCFTWAGAQAAGSTAPSGTCANCVKQVQTAILAHIDIRQPCDALGRYLQAGSLLDVAGARIAQVDPRVLSEACREWSRAGFPEECRSRWREECERFPHGRAAYARWPGCLLLGTRLSALAWVAIAREGEL